MDDFGTLARDFGFKPQGKSTPTAPPKSSVSVGSDGVDHWARSSSSSSSSILDNHNRDELSFNNVFGGRPKYLSTNDSKSTSSLSEFDYDSIFKSSLSTSATNNSKNKPSSLVYDKLVYDEDIFYGLPRLKSKSASSSARYEENVFVGIYLPPN